MNDKSKKYLLEKLDRIRFAKYWTDIPLLVFLITAVCFFILKEFHVEGWFKSFYQMSFFLFFLGFAMLFVQENIKCPNCGKKFNVKINGSSYFRNLFSRKCMNCGLRLNGKNVDEYANNL